MTNARLAVYPGSFDPLHNGHLDIIQRCCPLFDEVIVAVLGNEAKAPMFSVSERTEIIRREIAGLDGCRVDSFSGLLVDFMDREGAGVIVRGLRAVSDFEYEFQMALMNRRLNERVETVFLVPKDEYIYLSSRLVKEVFSLGGELAGLAPESSLERMAAKLESAQTADSD
ncbi:MAG: pantetheine-phosphate adenylyltransferase [Thermoanaerobaculia bacterium]